MCRHRTTTTLREKVVSHARYIILQLAEVAVSRVLFTATIGRIRRSRLLVEQSGEQGQVQIIYSLDEGDVSDLG